jgi:hypothetical protein
MANPALKPPAQVPKNAFFSLEERITPTQNWLSRTQPSKPKQPSCTSDHEDATPSPASPNLLASQDDAKDATPDTSEPSEDTHQAIMRSEITELRTMIQQLKDQLKAVSKLTYASHEILEKTDIMDLDENLHKLKRKCVQQDDYQASHDSFDDHLSKLETVRMTQKQWVTKVELKKHTSEMEQSMANKINTQITDSLNTQSAFIHTLHTRIEMDL